MGFLFSDYKADTAGQNFSANIAAQQAALRQAQQGQLGLAQALQQQAQGGGANPALGMLQRGTENAIKQGSGMIASQRGINPALAQRLAAQQAAERGQEAAQAGSILQAQQQQQALGQLGNVYGNMGNLANQAQGISQNALSNANAVNAGVEQANQNMAGKLVGGIASGVGSLMGLSHGGPVPGQPSIAGDHPANDTVPAMLSPGEIVIPRSQAKSPDKAKQFIDHIMGSKEDPNKNDFDEVTYADVLAYQKKLHELIQRMAKK